MTKTKKQVSSRVIGVGTYGNVVEVMKSTRQESTGITLVDIARAISTVFEKEELAVLINNLTMFHAKK